MGAALEGMKILDLTQYEAGTSCTQLLAWMGADVVKIEQPGVGDPGRHTERGDGDSLYFLSFNGNKRSVAINLRTAEGRGLFLKLLPNFDAVTENFTLGTMEKLGLGYDVLKATHPGIIYATLKGFGTTGPYKDFKCYDMVAQAAGGGFSLTGTMDQPPQRPGPTMGDTGTGMHLALGILAAYIQRQRTGKGQQIEVSMQESVASFIRCGLSHRERFPGQPVPRRGNRTVAPTDLYPCAPGGRDDYVYIMVTTTRMWDALVMAIDRPDLAADPRFATPRDRHQNGDALVEEISTWTRRHTKYEVWEHLGGHGVPCGAALNTEELLRDPHMQARNAIRTVVHPERGAWEFIAPPVRMSDSDVEMQPAPLLGQHTAEVLEQELGLSGDALRHLLDAGVIQARDAAMPATA
ncbi:MAG: CaiB/BaiF CoA transferase family protein [Dehalococcoidia bacterium]